MLFKLLFLLCVYEISSSENYSCLEKETFDLDKAKNIFDKFIKKFGKHYKTEEEYYRRLEIFKNNLEDINNRNKNNNTEVYGITQFLDKTDEEFNRDCNGLKWNPNFEDLYEEAVDLEPMINNQDYYSEVPDSWDWRDQGVVTPARQQGYCGSCWAFSAVGCVEGQYAIKHRTLYALSEQQLVDCFYEGGGCETGSWPHAALNDAARMGGFMKQQHYPYVAAQRRCRLNKRRIAVKVNGARLLKIRDEEKLKKLVYEYGPVSIAMIVNRGFEQYRRGISTPEGLGCAPYQQINHAILLVGYGTGDDQTIILNRFLNGTNIVITKKKSAVSYIWVKETWQDLLSKVKCKSAAINKSRRMTGGGPAPDPLDEFEEGMATLLNLNSIVGHEGVEESLVIFEEFEFVNADHISDHTYPSTSVDHTSDYLMENGNNDVSIPPPALFQDTENQDPNTTVDTQNTSENGVPFWIIKNSHGQNWGEKGFMRLIRGRNACSILQYIAIADVP